MAKIRVLRLLKTAPRVQIRSVTLPLEVLADETPAVAQGKHDMALLVSYAGVPGSCGMQDSGCGAVKGGLHAHSDCSLPSRWTPLEANRVR